MWATSGLSVRWSERVATVGTVIVKTSCYAWNASFWAFLRWKFHLISYPFPFEDEPSRSLKGGSGTCLAGAVEVTSCDSTISIGPSKSGKLYYLTKELVDCDNNVFDIEGAVENVVIDCQGNPIKGTGINEGNSAFWFQAKDDDKPNNIVIQNCPIENFYIAIHDDAGTTNLFMSNIQAKNNLYGLYVSPSQNGSYYITNSKFNQNTVDGAYVLSGKITIASSEANDNGYNGFRLAAASTVLNSEAKDNGGSCSGCANILINGGTVSLFKVKACGTKGSGNVDIKKSVGATVTVTGANVKCDTGETGACDCDC